MNQTDQIGQRVQKLWQVRRLDQTQYPVIVVASLSAVPQSRRTPLPVESLVVKVGETLGTRVWHTHTHH